MFTFGLGQFGQLGHGTFIFESRLPKPVEHFKKGRVCQVACGENHTAVITGKHYRYFTTISDLTGFNWSLYWSDDWFDVLFLFETVVCCTRLETADMVNWAWEKKTLPTSLNRLCVHASSSTTFRQ